MPLLHDHRICGCRRQSHDGFAGKGAASHYPPDLSIEPIHIDIDVRVDVDESKAAGTVTHTLAVNTSGAKTLKLDAVDLNVTDVTDRGGAAITWRNTGEHLIVTWEDALERGDERELAITYSVDQPRAGLYFSKPDAAYPNRPRWACTDHETERARHWLPTVDHPQVRAKLDFHLRADASFEILANGVLVGEDKHDDGTKTAHWKLDWPCPSYITCFALGDFSKANDGEFEGIELVYFAGSDHNSEDLSRSFARTGEMLGFLTNLLDTPFPYPKYYQFALPGIGGAMENISLVSWDDIFVLDETLETEWGWLVDQINIHEMAHSYFGDALVCRDFAHSWLKESWATYTESCWLEHKYGEDELLYDFYRNRDAYFWEADNAYKRPIVTNKYESSWQLFDRHLYPGGAARLHMLRRMLGDEVFWSGVQSYVKENLGKNVETPDFRRALEHASGRSLVQFFEQWIYSAGYPSIKAGFSWDDDSKTGLFTIEQQQAKPESKDPTFVMEMELGWFVDGELRTKAVAIDSAKHQFSISAASRPEFVRVDPNNKLVIKLDFNPGEDMLAAQMSGAADIIGRIQAGLELIKTNKRARIEAVRDAYKSESFWGVRQAWAKALGNSKTSAALEVLLELFETEQDPMVLETFVAALGSYRDEGVVSALVARLDALPYRARMTALGCLGGQGEHAPLELLEAKSAERTFSDFPQSGALDGLANTHKAEMLEVLFTRAKRSENAEPLRVRAAAMRAIGKLSRYVEERHRERAIDFLIDMLRDEDLYAATQAAYALVGARASRAASAIAEFKKLLPHQDQVGLQGGIDQLGAAKDPKIKELEEKLTNVTKDYQKLFDRLEKLEAQKKS